MLDLSGHGQPEQGRVTASAVHFTDDPRYAWLDRAVCAVAGEVRDGREIVLELARILWEPLGDYSSTA